MDQPADLYVRVQRLERSNRLLRLLALFPTMLFGLLLLLSMQQQEPRSTDEIRAKKIVAQEIRVENPTGRKHVFISPSSIILKAQDYGIWLSADENKQLGAQVLLLGPPAPGAAPLEGGGIPPNEGIGLACSGSGSWLHLRDGLGRSRATLGSQPIREGGKEGIERQHAESTFTLWDETGRLVTMLPAK